MRMAGATFDADVFHRAVKETETAAKALEHIRETLLGE
jgi:hypothetical protein